MFTPPNMSHVMCHVSRVTCHVSRVTCHVSRVTCHVSHVTCQKYIFKTFYLKNKKIKIQFFLHYKNIGQSGGASVGVEGRLSMGPTPSSLITNLLYIASHTLGLLKIHMNFKFFLFSLYLWSCALTTKMTRSLNKGGVRHIHLDVTVLFMCKQIV